MCERTNSPEFEGVPTKDSDRVDSSLRFRDENEAMNATIASKCENDRCYLKNERSLMFCNLTGEAKCECDRCFVEFMRVVFNGITSHPTIRRP